VSKVVRLIDTTVRDGNQSLWGATGLTTPMILAIAPAMESAGFAAIDLTSSTHMAVSVRYHHEDPFDRIRLMRLACPTTPLTFLTSGMRFVSWEQSPEAIMRLAFQLVLRHGVRRVMVAEPMNNTEAALRTARMAREEGAAMVVQGLVYMLSPLHDDDYYVAAARRYSASPDVDAVYVKDMGGLLSPDRARTLMPRLVEACAPKPFELHSHCTIGLAPVSYVEAAQAGVAALHTAVTPLGEGTSQPSTERTMGNLGSLGIDTGVDPSAVADMSAHFHEVAQRQGLPVGRPSEYDLTYQRHQVPGGMMTTMRRQLREIGLEHRLGELLEEVARVLVELGRPPMITPFSQLVGTQAMLNLTGTHGRYAQVPDQVVKYVLGRFGTPPGPVDPEVRDRILSSARARQLDRPAPEPSLADLRRSLGASLSDEQLLLRAVLPAEQVDAIRPTPPAGGSWAAAGPLEKPLEKLLRGLAARPDVTHFSATRGSFKLTLSRSA
jgi:oxaloacetate decarboxylase alpha subunit